MDSIARGIQILLRINSLWLQKKPVGDFANASMQTCHALHCAVVLDNVTEIN